MQEKPPIYTVPLANEFSQRPTEAFLHMQDHGDGLAPKIWIEGVRLDDYQSIVGPERAARYRENIRLRQQHTQPSVLQRVCRRIIG